MTTSTITTTSTEPRLPGLSLQQQGPAWCSQPPIERFMTIDGLLKSHTADPDDLPLIAYPETGVSDFKEYTAKDIDKLTDAAVARYIESGLRPADPEQAAAPVVAILAPSNLELVITIFALNRLGCSALFLSTRLTPPAYIRLLELAACDTIITTDQFNPVVTEIQKERHRCASIPMLKPDDYKNREGEATPFHRASADPVKESKKIAWIIHSSGSTGFPKPIFLSNYACLANFRKSFALRAFCTSPLFHSHGLMELFRAFYTKSLMFLGNYAFPVTRQNLIESMGVAKPQLMCAVPYVLKLLAETESGIQELAKAKLVLFAGSSCPDELGDKLVSHGVNLVANYGATETGQIMTSFRPPGDNEWAYMRLHKPVANHVLMDEIAPGVYECVALDGLPSKGPSNSSNPPNSFRTRDLFVPHPDPKKSNFWKYLSRLDDRITLVNGEKVLPIPVEGRIRQHEYVREAVVFGVQRTVPGVLVFKSERASNIADDDFLDIIWPTIEAANSNAETFSRIPRELVVIVAADTSYPRTDKGTFIRAQLYQEFSNTIDAAYERFENVATGNLQLDQEGLESFLLSKFRDELAVALEGLESDIFAAGVDSLQTTRMWRIIKQELDLGEGGEALSQNVVFEKGNVRELAKYLYLLRTSQAGEDSDELEIMREMIERYSKFEQHIPSTDLKPEKHTILVTGTTGNLGAFILGDVLKRDDISEVWALVRAPDGASARSRVLAALASRHIKLTELEASKLVALPSNFSDVNLGLSEEDLDRLLSSMTHVIHSAWAVNFNLGVRSFEAQHIRGVHNLINLCLRVRSKSPAKMFFCSSVSAGSGTPKPAKIRESTIEELAHAQRMGYGRSKLVAEHIVRNSMRMTGMHSRTLRIGQLAGDLGNGDWNETEAVALMIRSALTVGALPALDECPSWLPVDICAKGVIELVFPEQGSNSLSQDPDLVYHLVNPRTFNWTHDLLAALRHHSTLPKFDIIDPQEWLARLKRSDQDPVKNPSIKLITFWEGKYGAKKDEQTPGVEGSMTDDMLSDAQHGSSDITGKASLPVSPVGPPRQSEGHSEPSGLVFETQRTVRDCPALGSVPDLIRGGYIARYVDVWMKKWGDNQE